MHIYCQYYVHNFCLYEFLNLEHIGRKLFRYAYSGVATNIKDIDRPSTSININHNVDAFSVNLVYHEQKS